MLSVRNTVMSARQWRAKGISPPLLRSLVRSGELVRMRQGVYATKRAVDWAGADPVRAHVLKVLAATATVGGKRGRELPLGRPAAPPQPADAAAEGHRDPHAPAGQEMEQGKARRRRLPRQRASAGARDQALQPAGDDGRADGGGPGPDAAVHGRGRGRGLGAQPGEGDQAGTPAGPGGMRLAGRASGRPGAPSNSPTSAPSRRSSRPRGSSSPRRAWTRRSCRSPSTASGRRSPPGSISSGARRR